MDPPSCFIHIGAPKTGSTFLQKILFDNRSVLALHDILYPEVSLRGYGHHDIAFLLDGGYPEWATPQQKSLAQLGTELKAAAREHRGHILLSSEDFYLFPQPAGLLAFLEQAGVVPSREPVVIVYVRRQDDAHESWYNQTIKAQGCTDSIDESVRRFDGLWDYEAQLERWVEVFGRKQIVVRPYGRTDFHGGSITTDFFSLLAIDPSELALPPERVNSRINNDLLDFQRLVNRLPLTIEEKRRFHRLFIELTARTAGSGIFAEGALLSEPQRRAILDRYRNGNRAVAQKYLHRDHLFYERDTAQALSAPPELTLEKLSYIFGWLMARGDGDATGNV